MTLIIENLETILKEYICGFCEECQETARLEWQHRSVVRVYHRAVDSGMSRPTAMKYAAKTLNVTIDQVFQILQDQTEHDYYTAILGED